MAKNLSELPARTATADSDLLHINTGGGNNDYKMTRANFLSAVTTDIANLMKRGGQRTISDPDTALQWGYVYGISGSSKMPTTDYWSIVPIQYSESTNSTQLAFYVNSLYPQMWIRVQNSSGTWGTWREIYPEVQTTPTYTLGSGLSGSAQLSRYGKVVVVSLELQVPSAKSFSANDTIMTITPAPGKFTRFTASAGSDIRNFRINTSGVVTLNNAWSASASAYVLGQFTYITA